MTKHLYIGQVAAGAGISVEAVRYYERLGLLEPVARTVAGYRVYGPKSLDRLRFIRRAQSARFRLAEIRQILELRGAGRSPCGCVRSLLRKKLERVELEMRELTRLRSELRAALARSPRKVRRKHSPAAICPILEPRAQRAGKLSGR